jgi:hypothetical protein
LSDYPAAIKLSSVAGQFRFVAYSESAGECGCFGNRRRPAGNDNLFRRLCGALKPFDWARDSDFATNAASVSDAKATTLTCGSTARVQGRQVRVAQRVAGAAVGHLRRHGQLERKPRQRETLGFRRQVRIGGTPIHHADMPLGRRFTHLGHPSLIPGAVIFGQGGVAPRASSMAVLEIWSVPVKGLPSS